MRASSIATATDGTDAVGLVARTSLVVLLLQGGPAALISRDRVTAASASCLALDRAFSASDTAPARGLSQATRLPLAQAPEMGANGGPNQVRAGGAIFTVADGDDADPSRGCTTSLLDVKVQSGGFNDVSLT